MLQELSIKNFAIIEDVQLSFTSGMTILTGETGAGKSIIIDAMTLLLGGRASSDFVRRQTEKAEIEGLFFADENQEFFEKLEEHGLEATREVILRREISREGRSVCRINGQLVNLTTLKEVSEFLIDIHGQHDNQELMNPKKHLQMLDDFGDGSFLSLKKDYQNTFDGYRNLRKKFLKHQENEKKYTDRMDILKYQIEEIESAEIELDRDENLSERRDKLKNIKEIAEHLHTAAQALDSEEESGLDMVETAMDHLEAVSAFDKEYEALSEKLSDAYYVLEDVSAGLESFLSNLEFNAEEFTQFEERIFQLTALKRKYGPELSDVLRFLENCYQELSELTNESEDIDSLEKDLKLKQKELLEKAEQLSEKRHEIAAFLEADIKHELADLYMEKADFTVKFEEGKFSIRGHENVEFYIKTNPGEDFKPLVKIASGGELSRLMLAIKSSFSRREDKTVIVFDEVDTGVSGRVAQAIADKIYKIAHADFDRTNQASQVLAISHLPQVVAIADTQFYIEKTSGNEVTTSTVRPLSREERVRQIAGMLAGANVTEEALAQARKLLLKA